MQVNTANSPYARLKSLPPANISICPGFWSDRQAINHEKSLKHGYRKLQDSGNFENLKLAAGLATGDYHKPLFMDSDVYKWLEAVAYELGNHPDPGLEAMADEAIDLIAAAQQPDGYLNSYFQVVEPGRKWQELAMGHELYCAGHLFEAAIAHHRATGKTRLLEVAYRLADHIDATFGLGKRDGVPGHPEVELALVELYRESGRRRYLDLSVFFIDQRGRGKMTGSTPFPRSYQLAYQQDRVPVREADGLEGHAVRQLYLLAGVADVYLETGEQALLDAAMRLWHDMTARKLYVTGGLGARDYGESFGLAYELPNDTAYAETCATIAGMMWNWRMLAITGEAKYADQIETMLYNGFLSGISLDGQRYFYVNPLSSPGGIERPEWHGCACCPPNVMRQIASLGQYIATTGSEGLQIHQYIAADLHASLGSAGVVKVRLDTDYPWDGKVRLTVDEPVGTPWEIALRIPAWCRAARVRLGGQVDDVSARAGGYVRYLRSWQAGDVLELDLDMEPRLIQPNPRIDATRGSLAIACGPLVYCLEATDLPAGVDLLDVRIRPDAALEADWREAELGGVRVIRFQGAVEEQQAWDGTLYRTLLPGHSTYHQVDLTAVPYYAWANRGPGAMRVWLPCLFGD